MKPLCFVAIELRLISSSRQMPKLLIIPTTYLVGIEKGFTLKVMCNHKCRLNQVGADGKDIVRDAAPGSGSKTAGSKTKKKSTTKK